jgi:hypothetical protein
MAANDEPEDAESDHEKAGTDLDLALPFDEPKQQREGKEN